MNKCHINFIRIFSVMLMMLGSLCVYANSSIFRKDNREEQIVVATPDRDLQTLFFEIANSSLPKEKVYLHLDNTSYYKDDTLWFRAYIVNSDGNTSDVVSKTLYVDLLNPGGDVIQTKVLKIENGRTNGCFKINCIPFYSGFFEIRAYTKYMMNFGPETAFSRVIPVFDAPKKEGDYLKRKIRSFGSGHYQYSRKRPKKGEDFDVRFFPEGGHLIKGIPIKVAFEATDKTGHPIDIQGCILSANQDTIITFRTKHEGKGIFVIKPDRNPMIADLKWNDKTKRISLPDVDSDGYSLAVDNLSNKDSVSITIRRGGISHRKDTVGVVLTSHGIMKVYSALASSFKSPVSVSFDRNDLSPGVVEATLIDITGHKIADRMFFNLTDSLNRIDMSYEFDKTDYEPYEEINMTVSLSDSGGDRVRSPFSMSVRDGSCEVDWNRNIMTDLLLMSDIKGYVTNPGYYFAHEDSVSRNNLDLLMMVQGWRKYSWESLKENRNDNLRFKPETDGIDICGKVKSFKNKPMSGVDVTAFLMKGDREVGKSLPPMDVTRTDSLGRYSFTVNIDGPWSLILNTCRKHRLINSQISLDKAFVPHPRQYNIYEMEIPSLLKKENFANDEFVRQTEMNPDDTPDDFYDTNQDSKDKAVWLDEVVVKAKQNWKDDARSNLRKNSVAYYEVDDEVNDLRDKGEYINIGSNIHDIIMKVNPNFTSINYCGEDLTRYKGELPLTVGDEILLYKGKMPLIVIDYERIASPEPYDYYKYKNIRLESIKSISVSEATHLKGQYCWNLMSLKDADETFSCVVMIETYPDDKIIVDGGKGIRKTKVHGYDSPQEFYSPDYSSMPLEKDYRRTLYWNPAILPDERGRVKVRFYNNGNRNSNLIVDMQTITSTGAMGASR